MFGDRVVYSISCECDIELQQHTKKESNFSVLQAKWYSNDSYQIYLLLSKSLIPYQFVLFNKVISYSKPCVWLWYQIIAL